MPRNLQIPASTGPVLRFPDRLNPGLLVGWSLEKQAPRRPIGFNYGDPNKTPATGYIDPILLGDEGHLITIAPTGAGKGVGCVVPAQLCHQGPLIVVDPKGESVHIAARRRRELGQAVIVLDPMGITDFPTGQLNPLDLIDVATATASDDAAAIVGGLWPGAIDPDDRFWVSRAMHLLIGTMQHVLTSTPRKHANFARVRDLINSAVGNPEPLLEAMRKSENPEVRRVTDSFGIKAQETLGGILAFAQELVDFFRGPLVQHATAETSFDLDDVTRGKPLSIFIVLPPHMLESHGRLLRLWISTLISAITRRRARPAQSTLFLLDEAAQLGALPQLRQALTLLRGYGLQTWSFWQDVSQLQLLYPADWRTMVNNCRVLQCFGALNMNAARDMAQLTGFDNPQMIMDLAQNEMLLQLAGDEAVIARVPNYRFDPPFARQFDDNPYYDTNREIMPKRVAAVQFYQRPTPKPSFDDRLDARAAARGNARAPQGEDGERSVDPLLEQLLKKWSKDSGNRS